MIQEIRKWLEREKEKDGLWTRILALKKSDWAVIALVGVLLLVISMPIEKKDSGGTLPFSGKADSSGESAAGGISAGGSADAAAWAASGSGSGNTPEHTRSEAYVSYLEEKLKSVLAQMDGVGRVEVMITVSDMGEYVVEKDTAAQTTVTSETDSAGGSRTISENSTEEQTIYVETEDAAYPYIQKEKLPTIVGVVVVAEGGGNSRVISDISESVQALLPVEAHRIKIVRMSSKEE